VVETLSAEFTDPVPGVGEVFEKVHLAPLGRLRHVSLTDELKVPPSALTVTV
jgi:hypothetical protein